MIVGTLNVAAQSSTNSPYTRYGLGDLQDKGFVNNAAMGGIGYALRNSYHINMTNPAAFYENYIGKSIKDFIARRFENACREYFALLVSNGIRVDILDIGTYWYDDKANRQNGEFDVALKTADGYEIYDAKFVSHPLAPSEAEKEHRQLSRIPIPLAKWGIISASGFEKKDESYIQLTLDDLYAPE